MNWTLAGWKTYILVIVYVAWGFVQASDGIITWETFVSYALEGGALAALRAGVAKSQL